MEVGELCANGGIYSKTSHKCWPPSDPLGCKCCRKPGERMMEEGGMMEDENSVESMPAWMVGASSVVQVDSGARARVSGSHAGLCQYASVCTHTT